MKELHLKYKMETGDSSPMIEVYDDDAGERLEVASDSYLEWLEDLAEKYLKQNLSRFSKEQLKKELDRRILRDFRKSVSAEKISEILSKD